MVDKTRAIKIINHCLFHFQQLNEDIRVLEEKIARGRPKVKTLLQRVGKLLGKNSI